MIEQLRTSLAELGGKMEKIETTSSVSAHRIGANWRPLPLPHMWGWCACIRMYNINDCC